MTKKEKEEREKTKKKNVEKAKEAGAIIGSGLASYLLASSMGRPLKLGAGLAALLAGAFYNKSWVLSSGMIMLVSPNIPATGQQGDESLEGFGDELDRAKGRAMNALRLLGKNFYMDKISDEMKENMELQGMEDATDIMMGLGNSVRAENFDTSEVDSIIRELEAGNADRLIEQSGSVNEEFSGVGNADINELDGLDAVSLAAAAY